MKKYLIDLGIGGGIGLACFVLSVIYSAFSRDAISSFLVLIILTVLSTFFYFRSQFYKNNHDNRGAAPTGAIASFICGIIIAYFIGFYVLLWISFATSSGPTLL